MDDSYALLGGVAVTLLLILIPIVILEVIAYWKLFEKAGEEGWKSIIPFYNQVILCRCFMGNAGLAAIPIATSAISRYCLKQNDLFFVGFLIYIVSIVFNIFLHIDMAKSFGKDTGFTLGLVFLPAIFMLILAFGNDQYYGAKGTDYSQNNFYGYGGYNPYIGTNGYQNNGYNNGYQNNGYNNSYQNNGYQNNDYNNSYQNNGYQNNAYNNSYQNNGYQNNAYNNNYQDNGYQNQNGSYTNPNTNPNKYQNPVNNYAGSSYQNPSNNNGVMDDIDTSKIDINNSDFK